MFVSINARVVFEHYSCIVPVCKAIGGPTPTSESLHRLGTQQVCQPSCHRHWKQIVICFVEWICIGGVLSCPAASPWFIRRPQMRSGENRSLCVRGTRQEVSSRVIDFIAATLDRGGGAVNASAPKDVGYGMSHL